MLTRAAARQQRERKNLVYPVHSLNEQPNVILDLIFSHLDLSELEDVFPTSRRLAAHLRRFNFPVATGEIKLGKLHQIEKFCNLARQWNLRSVDLVCCFDVPWESYSENDSFSSKFEWKEFPDMGKECPNLQEAAINTDFPSNDGNQHSAISDFISSFSGCRFLRSFNYGGPAVPSLGRLKQVERFRLECPDTIEFIFEVLEYLSELRSIGFRHTFSDFNGLTILQSYPNLEELEVDQFPSEAVEQLVKLPALKTLIIPSQETIPFPSIWSKFKMLERLVLSVHSFVRESKILPEIASLKEVEILKEIFPLPSWSRIQRVHSIPLWPKLLLFLSLNLQVESLTVHLSSDQIVFDEENLTHLARLLEIHQIIRKFQINSENLAFNRTEVGIIYSRCVTDRFFIRSPEHRQEFIRSLRELAEAKEASTGGSEERNQKRQRLEETYSESVSESDESEEEEEKDAISGDF